MKITKTKLTNIKTKQNKKKTEYTDLRLAINKLVLCL